MHYTGVSQLRRKVERALARYQSCRPDGKPVARACAR